MWFVGAEFRPDAGAEELLFRHVVHVDRDAQHGEQSVKVGADVSVADGTVVGAPVVHHGVGVAEGTAAGVRGANQVVGQVGLVRSSSVVCTWSGRSTVQPSAICMAGPSPLDQVDAAHGHRHAAFGAEARDQPPPRKYSSHAGVPGGGFRQASTSSAVTSHHGFITGSPSTALLACAVERGRAGVDQVQDAARGAPFQRVPVTRLTAAGLQ
jgi:hypothetical protein